MNFLKNMFGMQNLALSELAPQDRELISRIRAKNLTYLTDKKLAKLVSTCRAIEQNNLSGMCIEAGCALGGSTILISTVKDNDRPLFVYDVFGTIPPPTKEDTPDVHDRYKTIAEGKSTGIGGEKYYGYEENLYEVVQSSLKQFGVDTETQLVSLIKGLVQDTMQITEPVAFAHIDVDWYEPVKVCLERIFPNLVIGGSIILDDYHDWGGCRKATDEFLKTISGKFTTDDSAGSLQLVKIQG
jgi:asparagine synthase (glutamine-hydrolysing)